MEIKTILFYILLAIFILPSLFFGYTKLVGEKQVSHNFTLWGYPILFMKLLGLTEIVAALGLLFSTTRMLGIGTYTVILISAIYTHLKNKDTASEVGTAAGVLVLLMVILGMTVWVI